MTTATLQRPKTTAERFKEKGGTFRILIGSCFEQGPEGCECKACAFGDPTNHMYTAGEAGNDVIETTADLEARYNQPHSRKFERLVDGQPSGAVTYAQPPVAFPLEKMTVAQLLAVAEEEEVDVTKVKQTKEDLVKAIRAATIKG